MIEHRHRRRVFALAAVAGLALVLFAVGRSSSSSVAAAPGAQRTAEREPVQVASRSQFSPALDPEMLSSRALREALDRYERESIYPPSSHLWTEETAGQNQRWDQPFPVEAPFDDRPGSETTVRYASDRHHVPFGEALVSTIEVTRAARMAEHLPLTIHSAIVESAHQGRTGVSLDYRDDGQGGDAVAGDHIYTNRFVPSAVSELASANRVRLQADVEAGGVRKLVHLDFTYTPRPLFELVAVEAAVRDGSLAITLDLDVFEAGAYRIDADVLADNAPPIGWITQPWVDLQPGRQRVELALFGKVIRDRGIPGPYVIANLRAERRADTSEVEMWWSDPRTFRTPAFALSDFSADPWDAPERSEAIAAISRAIAEQEAAEGAAR